MKVIILAAGRGSRLGNYTKELPKALVDINGKSLIQRQIDLLRKNDIRKIIVITGFNPEKFNLENVSYIEDVNFDKHEQLGSLIAASSELSEDVLVIFGDILFHEKIIKQILSSDDDIAIPIDLNWTKSYEKRIDNPIELAGKVLVKDRKIIEFSENLPIRSKGYLIGEFLGIIKLKNNGAQILKKYLNGLEKNHKGKFHDAESFESAKITDILQELVDSGVDVNPIFVEGKWCEIDTPTDLEIARENFL